LVTIEEKVMATVDLKLNLPDSVVLEAKRAGLLTDQAIGRLIEEAVRREAGKRLLEAMSRLREANVPPLTEDEIAAEVAAVRVQRKAASATGQ
jgi:cytochrome P450